ncbi:MAG: hypothetical protein MH186_10150 [Marinobacter sp.]|nr:hypothetical protein [Marinobacter sp.]
MQPIVKACQANTADVAGHGPQPILESHQTFLGKRWIAEIGEGALYEYLAATQLARLFGDSPTKLARASNSSMKAPPNPGTFDW